MRSRAARATDRDAPHVDAIALTAEAREAFPEKVTAFRPDMAVHGRYGKPCPVCGTPIQRVVFARNEMNYCPTCQTGGKLLADRALSRLLAKDWPRIRSRNWKRGASRKSAGEATVFVAALHLCRRLQGRPDFRPEFARFAARRLRR